MKTTNCHSHDDTPSPSIRYTIPFPLGYEKFHFLFSSLEKYIFFLLFAFTQCSVPNSVVFVCVCIQLDYIVECHLFGAFQTRHTSVSMLEFGEFFVRQNIVNRFADGTYTSTLHIGVKKKVSIQEPKQKREYIKLWQNQKLVETKFAFFVHRIV